MLIADTATHRPTGASVRITGFYELRGDRGWRQMHSVHPDDPHCVIVEAVSACGILDRPWAFEYSGPVGWSAEQIENERQAYADMVERGRDFLFERDYPTLFARFDALSGHELIQLHAWRQASELRRSGAWV